MKINYNIKKVLQACSLLLVMITGTNISAQVGIGNTNPAAALDITSTDAGILIPRVALQSTGILSPLTTATATASELVYNTATAGDVTPGFYYLNPTANGWIRLATGEDVTPSWSLTGNAGTNAGTNFLGTTDTQDLSLRTDNTERMRFSGTTGNVGIGTSTPQKQLHVNGSLQVTNEIVVGDTPGTPGTAGQYLKSNGEGRAPTWESLANVVPESNGTVIAVNGQFLIAQEMIVQMSADYTLPVAATATPIGNLNVEIIDNENLYTGTAGTNSFRVSASGVYQVVLNMQLSYSVADNPVVGIWDDTLGNWVARVNDQHTATTSNNTGVITLPLQTQTLITSVNMDAARTYSFRISASTTSCTIKAMSSGSTGTGPVSQVSLKRLR